MRYMAGAKVKRAGIYNVLHLGHRAPHKAILQEGESFFECRRCGAAVVFEFVEPVTEGDEIEHIGYEPRLHGLRLTPVRKGGVTAWVTGHLHGSDIPQASEGAALLVLRLAG